MAKANMEQAITAGDEASVTNNMKILYNMVETSTLNDTRKREIKKEINGYFMGKGISKENLQDLQKELNNSPYVFDNQLQGFKIVTELTNRR